MGKDMEGMGLGVIEVLSVICLEGLRKNSELSQDSVLLKFKTNASKIKD
jgi:hypothetical protein